MTRIPIAVFLFGTITFIAPASRFNAGVNYDRGTWFGNLNLNFTD